MNTLQVSWTHIKFKCQKICFVNKPNFVDKYIFEKAPCYVIFCFDENANIIKYRFDSVDSDDFFVGKETM